MLPLRTRANPGAMAIMKYSVFPKLQHYWILTIILFNVISGHSSGRGYPYAEMQSVYSANPVDWATIYVNVYKVLELNIYLKPNNSLQTKSYYYYYTAILILNQRLFFGVYGISTFIGYLKPNPFSYKYSVVFQTIQINMSTHFNYQKHFYFKVFSQTVLFQTIQFSLSTQFRWQNSSISSSSV